MFSLRKFGHFDDVTRREVSHLRQVDVRELLLFVLLLLLLLVFARSGHWWDFRADRWTIDNHLMVMQEKMNNPEFEFELFLIFSFGQRERPQTIPTKVKDGRTGLTVSVDDSSTAPVAVAGSSVVVAACHYEKEKHPIGIIAIAVNIFKAN